MTLSPVICQRHLPVRPWADPLTARLPGLHPVSDGEWLIRDDAFDRQMALRDQLFTTRRADTFAALPESEEAQIELLDLITREVLTDPDYAQLDGHIIRPDQIAVTANREAPIVSAARLVQEDLLILQLRGDQHVLTAAALAFPASWMLSEKIGRPLSAIHAPVWRIDPEMDTRIERLFARLPAAQPVQRANALAYNDASLFQPRREGEARLVTSAQPIFVRVERQCLQRLPVTNAIVFSIHTYVVPLDQLEEEDAAQFVKYFTSVATPPQPGTPP